MNQFGSVIARLGRPKLAAWLVLAASGCQVIAGLTERSVGLAPCLHNSECASDQACLFRVCAPRCLKDVDCENGRCLDTESGNACVSANLATCVAGGEECPAGSVCSEGSCRTPCDPADPCRSDQVCTEDLVCVGTDRDHDPEAPPSSMGGSGGTGDKGGSSSGGLPADAGAPADGGSATSGSGGGGSGMGGNGGSQIAGNGGSAMGGNGGSAGGGSDADPSTGCAKPAALSPGLGTLMSSAMQRSYVLDVPTDYDQNTPYRLVIAWHPIGESGAELAAGNAPPLDVGPYFGLKAQATEGAIFVAPEAINGSWLTNGSSIEIQFARDVIAQLEAGLCIDRSRIFSAGWSLGGGMSVAAGCKMSDVFRAIAAIAGNNFVDTCADAPPIAYWAAQGTTDSLRAQGEAARNVFLASNGCNSSQPEAVQPAPCVAYQGCSTGHPVHWCLFTGAHVIPPFAAEGMWSFFSQF